MSLYRPKKSPYWHYDFVRQGTRFHGSTGTPDKEVAKAVEANARRRAVMGAEFGKGEEMILDDAFGRYMTEVAECQPSADTVEYQLGNLLKRLGAATKLSGLTDNMVATFISQRRGDKSRNGGLVSPASVNRETQLLRRVLYRARDLWGIEVPNLKWKKLMLREPDPRDRTLSAAEEARLIEEAADHLKAPIEFSLLTGVRLGNAINLDWSQVDFRAESITFRVKSRKPGGKVHVLPITDELLVLLANQGPKEAGRVFTYKGRPIKSWRTAWEAAKRRASLEDFRWHDLRHTAGTRMVQRGGDISIVQEVLGHADIATTRRYVHHATADKRRAMELLSRNSPEPAIETAAKLLKKNA